MIYRNAMQLKAFIKKKAIENNISAQAVMQNYMLERLLERISLSSYKNNFIIKGGFLISAIVGLNTRSTMDLDTTIKGFLLSHENIQEIFNEFCTIKVDDNISFEFLGTENIRENDDYSGIRVNLKAKYLPVNVPISVDITTGDIITPTEVDYKYRLLFDDREISIKAYSLETILSEKIETVFSRGTANTRPRDFYDIYILYSLRKKEINIKSLSIALENTAKKRGSYNVLAKYSEIMEEIKSDDRMLQFWKRYQKEFKYAENIPFNAVCSVINEVMVNINI